MDPCLLTENQTTTVKFQQQFGCFKMKQIQQKLFVLEALRSKCSSVFLCAPTVSLKEHIQQSILSETTPICSENRIHPESSRNIRSYPYLVVDSRLRLSRWGRVDLSTRRNSKRAKFYELVAVAASRYQPHDHILLCIKISPGPILSPQLIEWSQEWNAVYHTQVNYW